MMNTYAKTAAVLSDCGQYRYALERWFQHAATDDALAIIGLNPSTADAEQDDPTIRRCVGFAKAWGYGGIVMLNLFAFRATDPKVMRRAFEPVGPQNDATLRALTADRPVLCAWGAGGSYMARDRTVVELLGDRELICLGMTNSGAPRHPHYVPACRGSVRFTLRAA